MKPSAMLITPFQVEVGRESKILPLLHDGGEGDPRIEPNVENVALLGKVSSSALSTRGSLGQKAIDFLCKPDVRPFLLEESRDMFNRLLRSEDLFAGGAVEDRDGNPPGPLSGHTPIRTIF